MNCNCNKCNPCNTCPQTNPCASKCIGTITAADIADLVYVAGLDVNLCKKYSPIDDISTSYVDCNAVAIPDGAALVTCADFDEQLCETLTAYPNGADVSAGLLLIGKDCAAHAMPAFQAPLTVLDTNCIDLTLAANVLSAAPVISPTVGNIIECTANGLYADVCTGIEDLDAGAVAAAGTELVGADCLTHAFPAFQAPITANDTNCINLTLAANVLTADPIVSPTAGNSLECTANGLYVPDLCTQLADVGGIVLPAEVGDIFITNECIPRTLPANGGITVLDTVTVDLTLGGDGVLSADVEVSSVPDNILTVRPDGLAVRCTDVLTCIPNTIITAIDTPCLDLTVTEVPDNTFTITGSPVVSPTAGNQLSCTANGLYVAAAEGLTCEAIQDLFVDNVNVISPGQRILVDDCQTYLSPTFTPLDTVTIDTVITEDGLGNPLFSANVVLADAYPTYPAGCNGLVIAGDGLAAPPEYPGELFTAEGPADVYDAATTPAQIFVSPVFSLNITNPSDCRDAQLHLQVRTPQISWVGSNVAGGDKISTTLVRHINFPSLVAVQPVQNYTFRTVDDTGDVFTAGAITTGLVIGPGEAGTLGVSFEFEQNIGNMADFNVDRFILRAWLTTI